MFRRFPKQLLRPNKEGKLSSEFFYPLYPLRWVDLCCRHKPRNFSSNAAIAFRRLKVHHVDRRVLHSLNRLSLLTPWYGQLQLQSSSPDVTFHRRWNWIIAINGPNTRIEYTSPPCCFNNQLPPKYIAHLSTLCMIHWNIPYKHYTKHVNFSAAPYHLCYYCSKTL